MTSELNNITNSIKSKSEKVETYAMKKYIKLSLKKETATAPLFLILKLF